MVTSFAQISADALMLSSEEREQLAVALWDSLDPEDGAPLSEAWEAEIERRLQEVENGAETFSAEEVMAELKQKFP